MKSDSTGFVTLAAGRVAGRGMARWNFGNARWHSRYPIPPGGVNDDVRAGMGVSYSESG